MTAVVLCVPANVAFFDPRADLTQARDVELLPAWDPQTGSAHARWWKARLANSRIEMVPGGGHDILRRMWPRSLTHLAPGASPRERR
jgi:hypothetical protein